jgi:hypothetical protein
MWWLTLLACSGSTTTETGWDETLSGADDWVITQQDVAAEPSVSEEASELEAVPRVDGFVATGVAQRAPCELPSVVSWGEASLVLSDDAQTRWSARLQRKGVTWDLTLDLTEDARRDGLGILGRCMERLRLGTFEAMSSRGYTWCRVPLGDERGLFFGIDTEKQLTFRVDVGEPSPALDDQNSLEEAKPGAYYVAPLTAQAWESLGCAAVTLMKGYADEFTAPVP